MLFKGFKWTIIVLSGIGVAALLWLRNQPAEPIPFDLSWNSNRVDIALVVASSDGHFLRTEPLIELRQIERQLMQQWQPEGAMIIEAITNHWWVSEPSGNLMQLIAEPVPVGVGILSAIAERAEAEPEVIGRLLSADWQYASILMTGSAEHPISTDQHQSIKDLVLRGSWAQSWLCTSPQECTPITHN